MTLGVTKSVPPERDEAFSQSLRAHARSLDLTSRTAVGDWDYGQGIRRARGEHFFWELSSAKFLPLGIHHPLLLRPASTLSLAPQAFKPDLINTYPQLASWQWTLLPNNDPWLNKPWTQTSAWVHRSGAWLMEEDATLKGSLGWQGLTELSQLHGWAVRLDQDTWWIASTQNLPEQVQVSGQTKAWIDYFLSSDVLGATGRLQELRSSLKDAFPDAKARGLNLTLTHPDPGTLAQQGLSCDIQDDHHIGLCFPLSFLSEDISGLKLLLSYKG